MSDLAEEALPEGGPDCGSSIDDPEPLSEVGEYMLRWYMTIADVFIVDDEGCDRVTFRQDQLMFCICWQEDLSKTTTYSQTPPVVKVRT